MNTQEREQLIQFLQQLTQAQTAQKDVEADTLIREACIRQTDAAYLLVQRAMLLDQALQNSQAQIARLQEALDQARNETRGGDRERFLDANAWGSTAVIRPNPPPQTLFYPASPTPAVAPIPAPSVSPATSAWGSGMLGTIATTAAGVVAGGFLFQGIQNLLGSQGANSGLMNGLSRNATSTPQDIVANNEPIDNNPTNAGFFDTSSVDDFINSDMDNGA